MDLVWPTRKSALPGRIAGGAGGGRDGLAAGVLGERTAGPGPRNPETSAGRGSPSRRTEGARAPPAPGTRCGRGGARSARCLRCAGKARKPRPASPAPPDHAPTGGPAPPRVGPAPLDFRPELPRRRSPAAAAGSESASVRWGKPSGPASGAAAAAAPRFRAAPAVSGKGPRGRAVKRCRGPRGPALEAGAAGRARRRVSRGPRVGAGGAAGGAARTLAAAPGRRPWGGVCQASARRARPETLEPGPRRCRAVNPGSPFLPAARAGASGAVRPPWADAGRPAALGLCPGGALCVPRGPLSAPRCPRAFAEGGRRGGRAPAAAGAASA